MPTIIRRENRRQLSKAMPSCGRPGQLRQGRPPLLVKLRNRDWNCQERPPVRLVLLAVNHGEVGDFHDENLWFLAVNYDDLFQGCWWWALVYVLGGLVSFVGFIAIANQLLVIPWNRWITGKLVFYMFIVEWNIHGQCMMLMAKWISSAG